MSNEIKSQMKKSCQGSTHFKSGVVVMGNHDGSEEFGAILLLSPLAPGSLVGWLHLFFWVGLPDAIAHWSRISDVADVGSNSMNAQWVVPKGLRTEQKSEYRPFPSLWWAQPFCPHWEELCYLFSCFLLVFALCISFHRATQMQQEKRRGVYLLSHLCVTLLRAGKRESIPHRNEKSRDVKLSSISYFTPI